MSHHQLREDKTCLNCGRQIEEYFCTHCGQENVETRQSFSGLVSHFLEDLTHYEGKFWRTIKYLLFKPAYLSKEFLAGRRISYLPPVRLYIFISFITFLLPHFLPDTSEEKYTYMPYEQARVDSIMNDTAEQLAYEDGIGIIYLNKYKRVSQLDSAREQLKDAPGQMSTIEYWYKRKSIELRRYNPLQLQHEFWKAVKQSIPKALFIYMPLFALILWVFHNKKRWLFFDHAIFTLHYFSFILLLVSIAMLVFNVAGWIYMKGVAGLGVTAVVTDWTVNLGTLALVLYFFIAHYRLYAEGHLVSHLKSVFIIAINAVLLIAVIIITLILTLFMLH